MKTEKDSCGQEILAYFNGEDSVEIIERDDGFIDLSSGSATYFSEYKNWPSHEKKALKCVKGKVLDIGAGAGRVSLYLQSKGYDITAIDNSPIAIKVCKKRGVKNARVLPIEKISRLPKNSIDTILMFGNNFGLFKSYNNAKKILKQMYRITSDNALVIVESTDPYKTKDPVHLSYHKFNRERGRMPGQLRIRVRFKKFIGCWFDYLLVSKKEMEKILEGTGWRIRKYINSDKSSYIAIIEKNENNK
jgi:ubiquinone/menaquinone biosynthesis C-methylase UbiE